jgi:hypothetical protein
MSLFEMDTTESVTQSTTNGATLKALSNTQLTHDEVMRDLVWHNTLDVGHDISPEQQLKLEKIYKRSSYDRDTRQKRRAFKSEVKRLSRKAGLKFPASPDWAPESKSFWTVYKRHFVNLSTPATAGNRGVNVSAVEKHLRDGFNPALWVTPKVVAIPGFLLRQAMQMEKYQERLSMYHIVEEGFQEIDGTEWYVCLIDGEHRRMMVISLKGIDLSTVDNVLQVPGKWEVDVTFAQVYTPDGAVEAVMDAYNLMTQMNGKKIRKWGEHEEFFGDIFAGNEDAKNTAIRLANGGVFATNGRTSVGCKERKTARGSVVRGLQVQIPQYRYQLKDKRLNDAMRLAGVDLALEIIAAAGFTPEQVTTQLKTTFLHTMSLLMAANPNMRKKNGLYTEFVSYMVDRMTQIKNEKRVDCNKKLRPQHLSQLHSLLKRQGGELAGVNSHHSEELAIYAAIVDDFKKALLGHSQYGNFKREEMFKFVGLAC